MDGAAYLGLGSGFPANGLHIRDIGVDRFVETLDKGDGFEVLAAPVKDYRPGEEVMSSAYIDTSKGLINIIHPFNYQPVSPQAIAISRKPSLWH